MAQAYIDFAFVKANASFERILAHYNLETRGTGPQRYLSCPFHQDKKPSCRVEIVKGIFQCFACGAHGNVLDFVALKEGTPQDLRGAAAKIAEICNIATAPPRAPPGKSPRAVAHRRKGARAPKPAPAAPSPSPATQEAPEGPVNPPLTFELKLDPAHPYLAERGLSPVLISEFGLGYCSRGSMAGRIAIPIHNEHGELVAYAGRWPGEPPEGEDRYKLPAKFQKSRVLFNLHRVAVGEHIVLVEGYWSSIRLHALGAPVVGLMGSSASVEQLALLRERGIRRVTALWDGDDAGNKARERALPALANAFFVHAPLLPEGEKPDTLGEAALLELLSLHP